MAKIPTWRQIKEVQKPNPWNFGNQVLYDLCRNNYRHVEIEKIIAKVWLIGRAYSAAIERRKNKSGINDHFYIKKVVPNFKKSNIDEYLSNLKKIDKLTDENLKDVLKAHFYLTKIISRKKFTAQNKSSFSSKYLHFHLPNLFCSLIAF